MSTIQADVLQLSWLSDSMLLKWSLQSVFFPLVTRGRQKWLEALPGCGSEPWEGGSCAKPLHACSQPARDKAVRKAGWSQVWAECSEPGFNQWPAVRPGDSGSVFLGSLFSQLVLGATKGVSQVLWGQGLMPQLILLLLCPGASRQCCLLSSSPLKSIQNKHVFNFAILTFIKWKGKCHLCPTMLTWLWKNQIK